MTDPSTIMKIKKRRSAMTNYNTPFDTQPDYPHFNATFNDPTILSDINGTEMLNINSNNSYDKQPVMPLKFKISK